MTRLERIMLLFNLAVTAFLIYAVYDLYLLNATLGSSLNILAKVVAIIGRKVFP